MKCFYKETCMECEHKIRAAERVKVLDEVKDLIKVRLVDNLALANARKCEATSKFLRNSYEVRNSRLR